MYGRRRLVEVVIALAIVGAMAAVCPAWAADATYKGVVEVAGRDDEGNPNSVEIWDEENYETLLVANEGKGAELLNHIGKRVQVTGSVTETAEGDRVLTVKSYTVLGAGDPAPQPEPEPEPDTDSEPEPEPGPEPTPDDGGDAGGDDYDE